MLRPHFAIFLFAVLAGATSGFGTPNIAHGQENGFISDDPPRQVPIFQFEDEKGRTLDLKDLRGSTVLLNLWATSCAPCAAEMPTLNELSKRLDGRKFKVIALSEDPDGIDAARFFYRRLGIDHLSIYSDPSGRAPFILNIRGLPTTLLINPEGLEIAHIEGAVDWTKGAMTSFLESRIRP